jgi:hypothetical protein
LVPEQHNKVKLLLFIDVGGSTEDHVRICEEVFSAARSEFDHLVHFYFHNCIYDSVWRDSRRRQIEQTAVMELIHTYDASWRVVLVGDVSMSPYEIGKEVAASKGTTNPAKPGYAVCSTFIRRRCGSTRCRRNIGPALPASGWSGRSPRTGCSHGPSRGQTTQRAGSPAESM